MGNVNKDDDRTFKANYTGEGVAKLREKVNEKLKEYMGDYTDDTLVEYVIVLLKNGRRKEEARNELNVFLGDDSHSFVSWLWDHLSSNLGLYVQRQESFIEEGAEPKRTSGDHAGRNDASYLNSESERKPNQVSRTRHNREWKGLVRDAAEPPPLLSSEINYTHLEEKTHHKIIRTKRSVSPQHVVRKKRNQPDERPDTKEAAVSKVTIGASRRLLQFAVRDAVGTSRPSNTSTEPTLKRLRSAVSMSSGDSSVVDRPRRLQSIAGVPNPRATVMKAAAKAVDDIKKVKSSVNVFDRLGHDIGLSETNDQLARLREAAIRDGQYENFDEVQDQIQSTYLQRTNYSENFVKDTTMLGSETGLAYDSTSDNESHDDVNVMGSRITDVSQMDATGGNKVDDSLLVRRYNVAKNVDDVMRVTRNKDHDKRTVEANASRKVVNISVNVNTWKPPHYQEPTEVADVNNQISVLENDASVGKFGGLRMDENRNVVTVANGNAKPAAENQVDSQKTVSSTHGLYSSGRPLDDADSRTIFVSNVHFAATKDSLSCHFNKFGEVVKVVIVTDAATGQPKGSAYVEFARKEAADDALSLNGTSFLSRILKVVIRSSTQQEAAPVWPRIARGSPFAVSRFARAPFPRGMTSTFRPRLPLKPGARSMQWKRDGQATPGDATVVQSPTARSLTYVRPEPKSDGNAGSS